MANIKSFPNNQDEYIGAEDVMRWHHGRTSGVFGADNNAAVAPVLDAMAVTVSDGIGWLTNEIGFGVVWWVDEEARNGAKLRLAVDMADAVLPRIDRVVVSWQTTNYVALPEVVILKGTPASAPTAPALTNNSMVRQISLAAIRIPAGATSINAAMITDERLDASVCGIVTEKVGVDTSVMQAQFQTFWANNVADFEDYMARQKAAWERFFQDVSEDSVFPVPALEDAGKAVMVNETGDGYTLEKIQTEIPVTSEPEEDVDLWIDPNEEPQVITRESIGAAPAGYGYGGTPKTGAAVFSNLSEMGLGLTAPCTTEAFVKALKGHSNVQFMHNKDNAIHLTDVPFDYGNVEFHKGANDNYIYGIGVDVKANVYVYKYHGSQIDTNGWYYANPPMALGVEYRTTERWNGKVVYTKLIDFGALPNATEKTVAHGVYPAPFPLSVTVTAKKDSWSFTLPSNYDSETAVMFNSGGVTVKTTIDRSDYNAYATLKYTKD